MPQTATWEQFYEMLKDIQENEPVFGQHPPMIMWRSVDPYTFAPTLQIVSEDGKRVGKLAVNEHTQIEWKDR